MVVFSNDFVLSFDNLFVKKTVSGIAPIIKPNVGSPKNQNGNLPKKLSGTVEKDFTMEIVNR